MDERAPSERVTASPEHLPDFRVRTREEMKQVRPETAFIFFSSLTHRDEPLVEGDVVLAEHPLDTDTFLHDVYEIKGGTRERMERWLADLSLMLEEPTMLGFSIPVILKDRQDHDRAKGELMDALGKEGFLEEVEGDAFEIPLVRWGEVLRIPRNPQEVVRLMYMLGLSSSRDFEKCMNLWTLRADLEKPEGDVRWVTLFEALNQHQTQQVNLAFPVSEEAARRARRALRTRGGIRIRMNPEWDEKWINMTRYFLEKDTTHRSDNDQVNS